MPVREGPPQPAPPPKNPAEKPGAPKSLRTQALGLIFAAGLIGALLLALALQFAR